LEYIDNKYGKNVIVDAINQLRNTQKPKLIYQIDNGKIISNKIYKKKWGFGLLCG
jgi:hypothetical protein